MYLEPNDNKDKSPYGAVYWTVAVFLVVIFAFNFMMMTK